MLFRSPAATTEIYTLSLHDALPIASRVETPAELEKAFDEAFGSGQPWLLDVVTDPVAHPPVSLYDGTLGKQAESGPVQHAVG